MLETPMKPDDAVIVRVTYRLSATAERVFDAWVDPAQVGKFLFATPNGQIVKAETDPRVGGAFTIVDRRGGEEVAHTGSYLELDRPRRIVFTLATAKYGPDDAETVTVAIEPQPWGAGCAVTLEHEMKPGTPLEKKARAIEEWTSVFDLLEEILPPPQPTCGMGLALHSTVPTRVGVLFRALADTMELHRTSLRLEDPQARLEDDAYQQLASNYRQLATLVQSTALQMAGYRDLPMATHDPRAFGPDHVEAFERYVKAQNRLLAILKAVAERDEKLLAQITARSAPQGA